MSTTTTPTPRPLETSPPRSWRGWWPLAALVVLAAVLRLSTIDLQSFWYDEAFTPVHVLHASLGATLRAVVRSENTPPLWYLIAWADARVLGTGEVALRLPSALAGIATVPVAWAIGRELAGRRAAILGALLVAVSPLFIWYSQEARAYALFVLMAALAMLCFLRAERNPSGRNMALFALTGALALLSHYFAVFLLLGMALWLLAGPGERRARTRRAALPALAALALVGLALLPLISAQGGHGTQWIGRWALSARLQAVPQYYLTGYAGAPLGHGVEALVAVLAIAGAGLGLWTMRARGAPPGDAEALSAPRGALIAGVVAVCGVLTPIVLVALGADYLAPRNLVAAMIPVSALLALLIVSPRMDGGAVARARLVTAALLVLALLAVSLDVNVSPRLQRGNWRGLARALRAGPAERAITTVELGSAPLEYYMPGLRHLRPGGSVRVSEIDETGYAPLRSSAGEPPAPGFVLVARVDVDGLIAYRFRSPVPRLVSEAALRRHVITDTRSAVLISDSAARAT
jgi:4-amino-4-deoxy-L-arabinose transferase-like glycosyltransferase